MKWLLSIFFGLILSLNPCTLNAAIYVVNSTGDGADMAPGDGICADPTGACTLRAAMMEANASPGVADVIQFNIPPGGFLTIFPLTQLPILTDQAGVTIDGLTQPGGAFCDGNVPNHNLLIEIDGANAGPPPVHGIWIGSDLNRIQGLVINNFSGDGVRIEGGAGGPGFSPHADQNNVNCNIIGTNASGSAAKPNGTPPGLIYAGVTIKNTLVQETATTARNNIIDANLISGNIVEGVQIIGPVQPGDVGFNQVLNNFIGTDLPGMGPIPNQREGVELAEGTHDNLISSNLISANLWDGIGIQGFNNIGFLNPPIYTSRNIITNNRIGVDNAPHPAGMLGNGNHGIAIGIYGPNGLWGYADSNQVLNNVIWYNTGAGIALWEDKAVAMPPDIAFPFANTDMNFLSQNSIWLNGGLGIDIEINGVTFNDGPADPDMAANEELNFPYNMTIAIGAASETVNGNADPAATNVEVYLTNPDPSGYGEGFEYLGSATPNALGQWSVTTFGKITVASFVTAIAQDGIGNTSEFGLNVSVPLALDLISFDAIGRKNSIEISWVVENHEAITFYHLQKAAKGEPFNECALIMPHSDDPIGEYYYTDYDVRYGLDYMYRIGMETKEGTMTYTPIRMASISRPNVRIYPNPVGQGTVFIQFEEPETGTIEVISNTGQVLSSNLVRNQLSMEIDLDHLLQGHYLIQFVNERTSWIERLIVL